MDNNLHLSAAFVALHSASELMCYMPVMSSNIAKVPAPQAVPKTAMYDIPSTGRTLPRCNHLHPAIRTIGTSPFTTSVYGPFGPAAFEQATLCFLLVV